LAGLPVLRSQKLGQLIIFYTKIIVFAKLLLPLQRINGQNETKMVKKR
jgi:hypothetical protein